MLYEALIIIIKKGLGNKSCNPLYICPSDAAFIVKVILSCRKKKDNDTLSLELVLAHWHLANVSCLKKIFRSMNLCLNDLVYSESIYQASINHPNRLLVIAYLVNLRSKDVELVRTFFCLGY